MVENTIQLVQRRCIMRRTRDIKARAEEFEDYYEEAREQEFDERLRDLMDGITVNEDDVSGFVESFSFKNIADWCWDKANAEYEDAQEAKYQQMKDEKDE